VHQLANKDFDNIKTLHGTTVKQSCVNIVRNILDVPRERKFVDGRSALSGDALDVGSTTEGSF